MVSGAGHKIYAMVKGTGHKVSAMVGGAGHKMSAMVGGAGHKISAMVGGAGMDERKVGGPGREGWCEAQDMCVWGEARLLKPFTMVICLQGDQWSLPGGKLFSVTVLIVDCMTMAMVFVDVVTGRLGGWGKKSEQIVREVNVIEYDLCIKIPQCV